MVAEVCWKIYEKVEDLNNEKNNSITNVKKNAKRKCNFCKLKCSAINIT